MFLCELRDMHRNKVCICDNPTIKEYSDNDYNFIKVHVSTKHKAERRRSDLSLMGLRISLKFASCFLFFFNKAKRL